MKKPHTKENYQISPLKSSFPECLLLLPLWVLVPQSPEEPLMNYCAGEHQQIHEVIFLGTVRKCHLGMSLWGAFTPSGSWVRFYFRTPNITLDVLFCIVGPSEVMWFG